MPKNCLSRREFLQRATTVAAVASLYPCVRAESSAPAAARQIKICLSPGMIGVNASLAKSMELAAKYGFEAIEPNLSELASFSDSAMEKFRDDLKAKGLVLGAAGAGMPIGGSQEQFAKWMAGLPKLAAALQKAGGKRLCTWISCGDNKLTYLQNFRLHAQRVGEIAGLLGDYGISFGLEYIGPKTSWARQRYPFIHTMAEMKELIAETGKRNLGFLLDSWHWYTAGESTADLLTLRNQDIIGVHLNDAPGGMARDQQVDNRRALPAATGVIDIGGFLGALRQVGYDGPVAAEPFDDQLRKEPEDQILRRTLEAIQKAFKQEPASGKAG